MTMTQGPTLRDYLYSKVGFEPTKEQVEILASKYRFNLVAGGEQAGKSLIAAKYLLGRFAETESKGLYWLVAADYERTRAEFEYLVQDFATLQVLKFASKRVDPGYIELTDGTRIETKSAKDPRTLAMRAPDGIRSRMLGHIRCRVIRIRIFTLVVGMIQRFRSYVKRRVTIFIWSGSKGSQALRRV